MSKLTFPKNPRTTTLEYRCSEKDETARDIAYMLNDFRGWRCIGLVPFAAEVYYQFGIELNGRNYTSVFYCPDENTEIQSDDYEKEHDLISLADAKYICLFYGSDNTSYMKRFLTKEDMHKFLDELEEVCESDLQLYYNS
jgi:hypothetical protein